MTSAPDAADRRSGGSSDGDDDGSSSDDVDDASPESASAAEPGVGTTVGVVGAGITGLALVHALAERGLDVVAFEADAAPGGVIRSRRVDGHVLECGPQRCRLTDPLERLVDDLELRDRVLTADDDLPLYVYADGRLREVPRSPRELLRTDLLSWRGKLRLLAEPLTDPIRPEESAADAFRRKLGDEAYRNVVEPLFGGIYASDPAAMPAEHALDALRRAEQRHGSLLRAALARHRSGGETAPPASFDDGLQVLPRALYREHRPYVHLDAPVTSIDRVEEADTSNDGSGAESEAEDAGPGYQLRAGGRTVTVDEVVLTTPAPTAASLLGDLEGARTAGLADLTYNSLVLVHLLSDADVSGFGYQVRREEPLETRGVTWNASLFGRQHSGGQGSGERPSDGVYTAFLGGMSDPDAVDRSDDELGSVAAREFEAVVGAPAAVLSVERLPAVLPAYDESWAALDDVETPDGVHLAANYASRLGIASRVREAERLADELLGAVPARN